jgi:ZIP family zinc transporter
MYDAILIVAVVMASLHFIGEKISEHIKRFHTELLSLGAGLMIGVFFLEILPHIIIGEIFLGELIFITFLAGFVIIHLLEKYVYQRAAGEDEFALEVSRFEALGLIAYALLIGVIIVVFFDAYGNLAYFLLIPFYIRAFGVAVYSDTINKQIGSKLNRIMQTLGPIIGAIIGLLLIENETQLYLVFAVTMGFILYIIVRDMIPRGKEGKSIYFAAGVLITIAITIVFSLF